MDYGAALLHGTRGGPQGIGTVEVPRSQRKGVDVLFRPSVGEEQGGVVPGDGLSDSKDTPGLEERRRADRVVSGPLTLHRGFLLRRTGRVV